jgi:hypothetical protein
MTSGDVAPGWPRLLAAGAALWISGRLLDVASRAGRWPRAVLISKMPIRRLIREQRTVIILMRNFPIRRFGLIGGSYGDFRH